MVIGFRGSGSGALGSRGSGSRASGCRGSGFRGVGFTGRPRLAFEFPFLLPPSFPDQLRKKPLTEPSSPTCKPKLPTVLWVMRID